MNDNDLIQLIIKTVKAGLVAQNNAAKVLASNQPTQQGVTTDPGVYLFKVGDVPRGFLRRDDVWDKDYDNGPDLPKGIMVHTEIQWYETMFQFSALTIQTAAGINQRTASDLCNTVMNIIQGDAGREAMQAEGVGLLRISAVRNPPFSDDRARFEFSPNFDFTLTHERVTLSSNPVVETFEANIKRV